MANTFHRDTKVPTGDDILQFAKDHRVSLKAGDYTLAVDPAVSVMEFTGQTTVAINSKIQRFSVSCERFKLSPNLVRSVFPPAASKGDHWLNLPHIVLERSTLPWERQATLVDDPAAPTWLALLVFHPTDDPSGQPPTVVQKKISELNFVLPTEISDNPEQTFNTITVHQKYLPTKDELIPLSHVRRRLAFISEHATFEDAKAVVAGMEEQEFTEEDTEALPSGVIKSNLFRDATNNERYELLEYDAATGATNLYKVYHVAHEAATIIANRLPQPKAMNVVHLVSVEGRYKEDSESFEGLRADTEVELISLYQWAFYCEEETYTFEGLVKHLNVNRTDNSTEVGSLRLPSIAGPAEPFLDAGFVPLRHHFREGSRTISWYHGPLVSSEQRLKTEELTAIKGSTVQHIRHPDQLLLYDATNGFFDVSYAAAWELGRMLTLGNSKIALELYAWKQAHAKRIQATRHLVDYGYHFGSTSGLDQSEPDGTAIWKWLGQLSALQHIPFHYLIPNEQLLPPESLRLFAVDQRWIECLLDGAFSIGRVLEQDARTDSALPTSTDTTSTLSELTGFLLRSKLVSGYPDMQVAAYSLVPTGKTPPADANADGLMQPIRIEKLNKEVLLVVYEGKIEVLDFYLPPETLHFGFSTAKIDEADPPLPEPASNHPEELVVVPRDPDTGDADEAQDKRIPINLKKWGGMKDLRVINIDELNKDLRRGGYLSGESDANPMVHAGTIALQLLSSNELIRFKRSI